MKLAVITLVLAMSSSALAEVSIECGKNLNRSSNKVAQRTFKVSSEDGRRWSFFFSDSITPSPAQVEEQKGDVVVIVPAVEPIGKEYVIRQPRGSQFTTAEVFNPEGIASGIKIGQLECAVTESEVTKTLALSGSKKPNN